MTIPSNGQFSFLLSLEVEVTKTLYLYQFPQSGSSHFYETSTRIAESSEKSINSLNRETYISTVYFHKPLPSSLPDPILARNFLNILIFPHQKHRQRYHEKHRFNSLKWGSFFSTKEGIENEFFRLETWQFPQSGKLHFYDIFYWTGKKFNGCDNSLNRVILISTVYSHKPLNSRLSKLIFACNFLNILIFAYLWLFLCFFKNCISIHTIPSLNMSLFIILRLLLQWQFPQTGNSHFYDI